MMLDLTTDGQAAARRHLSAQLPDIIRQLRAKVAEHAPDAPAREAGFRIYNKGDEAVVRIYDEIAWYGVNAADFVAALDGVDQPRMRVEINSPGGDVFDGIAIYQALRNHDAHVTTRIDGIAASIASIIAQAGDTRIVQPASQMMIHNAWGLTVGDTNDHSDMASVLSQQDDVLAGIYAAHSNRTVDDFRELMNHETWLTAEQIVEHGLADQIVDPSPKPETASSVSDKVTLHSEIIAAVDAVGGVIDSVERVAALRAEAGKDLSNRIVDDLDGLSQRLDQLRMVATVTDDGDNDDNDDDGPVWTAEALQELMARRSTVHKRSI